MSDRATLPSKRKAGKKQLGATALDPQLVEILGPPPLLDGENLDAYNALYDRVRSAVAPSDIIEELWVRDVVDLTWETLNLRRMKTRIIESGRSRSLVNMLVPLFEYLNEARDLVRNYLNGDPDAGNTVAKMLAQVGADESTVRAEAFAARLNTLERVDQLIWRSEMRRNNVLREVDRRRDVLARRLREVLDDVTDAEEVEPTDSAAAA